MTMRRFAILAFLIASLAVPTAAQPPAPISTGGKLVYGLTLSPSGIDPHVNASSELGIALTGVYDPLIVEQPDATFVPCLARSWDVSPDGKTYTLRLRDDVRFHDGTRFDAPAVKVNLDRIMAPETKSQKARLMLGPFQRAEVVDDFTVRLVLSEPFAPLLDALSQVYIAMASPAALEQWGADYQLHQVGTGPFRFRDYVPNDHLTLTANPDYRWPPPSAAHDGRAYLDEVEFRFFAEPATRALALEGDEAQVMGEIPPQDALRLKEDPRFRLLPTPVPGLALVFFMNTRRAPTDDINVRRAILRAVDRKTIVDTLFKGFSPPAYGPLAADTLGYNRDLAAMYPFDPGKAADTLQSSGWTDSNGDGVREKGGVPLKLDAYLMTWGFLPEIGALLQAQLQAVGAEVHLQTVTYPAALQAGREGLHNLMPFNLSGSDPDILRDFFTSAGFNWSGVQDPELDRLLKEAAAALDSANRAPLYREAQSRIMDQALVIPIRDYVNINAASARVRDLRYDIRGWFPILYDVHLES